MASKQTGLPFHQQDGDDWCGAAIAQMMLGSIDGDLHDQQLLYQIIGTHNTPPWYTSPRALAYVLNDKRPRNFDRTFVACVDTRREDACERIASTIITSGIAVPAVVYGNAHWVAVTAVEYDEPDADGMHDVKGFYVNNPWPRTAKLRYYRDETIQTPPLPHAVHDACGGGRRFGSANMYVTSYGWRQIFWADPSDENGQRGYVTVSTVPEAGRAAVRFAPIQIPDGALKISPEVARRYAVSGIADHGIARTGLLMNRLRGAEPSFAEIVDAAVGSYYLVGFERNGTAVAIACVDARNGAFVGVLAPPATIPTVELARFALGATDHPISSPGRLIWHPSRCSLSPFFPLLAVMVADREYFVEDGPHLHPSIDDNPHA